MTFRPKNSVLDISYRSAVAGKGVLPARGCCRGYQTLTFPTYPRLVPAKRALRNSTVSTYNLGSLEAAPFG